VSSPEAGPQDRDWLRTTRLTILAASAVGLMSMFVHAASWRSVGVASLAVAVAIRGGGSFVLVPGGQGLSMGALVDVAAALVLSPPAAAMVAFAGAFPHRAGPGPSRPFSSVTLRANAALATAAAAACSMTRGGKTPTVAAAALVIVVYFAARGALERLAAATDGPVASIVTSRTKSVLLVEALIGAAGAALAVTYLRMGGWAIPLAALPIVLAREGSEVARSLDAIEHEQRRLVDRSVAERERERTRIASDIHGAVLQKLAAVQLQADNVVAALDRGQDGQAKQLAAVASVAASAAIDELRDVLEAIRRTGFEDDGALVGISRFARAFGAETGLEVNVHAPALRTVDLMPEVAEVMYEAIQEGLINAAQHAHANAVQVLVRVEDDLLQVEVDDDGIGVDPQKVHARTPMGLTLLREKLAFFGGSARLQNRPAGGAQLVVRLPLEHP
jgi:signal transduction histidine kinase